MTCLSQPNREVRLGKFFIWGERRPKRPVEMRRFPSYSFDLNVDRSCVMSRTPLPWVLFIILGILIGTACATDERADEQESATAETEEEHEEAELALHMTRLQRWTHKTTLALQARNPDLADFYLHEMEESIETIQTEAPTYEGYAVSELTEKMLVPRVKALDEALDDRNWEAVDARVGELAQSCNQCHTATDHGFVKVDLDDVPNPYAQDFSSDGE